MKDLFLILFCFVTSIAASQSRNVGVNTTTPQQKLHIAGANANMRIVAMDSLNNELNRNIENAPLYVTHEGVLSLEHNLFQNNNSNTDIDLFTVHQQPAIFGQNRNQELFIKTVTVTRPSYIEIKYTISFEVYLNPSEDIIIDQNARAIRNYILLDNDPARKYGITSKTYTNSHLDGAVGTFYNNASTYITLPTAGTYNLHFYGSVGSGANDVDTFVKFGTHIDMFLIREF